MPSRSESAPDWPAPRARPMASISSKKMIAPRSLLRAWANRSRTRDAPTPTNVSTKSDPDSAKKGTPDSPATALASSVLPVPGGPCSTTPRGIRAPTRRKRSGSSRKTTTSRSSSTASSQPATSAKRVSGGSTWAVLRILPWPAAPPRPPRPAPAGVAAPDQHHPADDEDGDQRDPEREHQEPHQPAHARAGVRRRLGRAEHRDPVRAQAGGEVEGAGQALGRRAGGRGGARGGRLGEVLAGLGARDGRGDDLALAVDGGDPVAGRVDDRGVQVARVGGADELAVGNQGGALRPEGLHDGVGDLGRLVGGERGGREDQRRQRREQGEWGPEMGQPIR